MPFRKVLRTHPSKVKPGFTLIELLIIIVVIGILASFAIVTFSSAQKKARDAQRKSDLDAIKKALAMYYSDYQSYPTTGNWVWSNSGGNWIPGLDSSYLKTHPVDPRNPSTSCHTRDDTTCFNYGYYSTGVWCGGLIAGKYYILVARLEAYPKDDLSKQPIGNGCTWSDAPDGDPRNIGLYVIGPF